MPAFEMSANGVDNTIIIEMTYVTVPCEMPLGGQQLVSLVLLNEASRFAEELLQRMYGTSSGAYVPFVIVTRMPGESQITIGDSGFVWRLSSANFNWLPSVCRFWRTFGCSISQTCNKFLSGAGFVCVTDCSDSNLCMHMHVCLFVLGI